MSIVVALALLAAAAEQSGSPFTVGEEVAIFPEGAVQDTPHLAFGKEGYLAVWTEGAPVEGGRARILAARISAEGKVRDARPITPAPYRNPDGPQTYPRVAFGGGVFLIVWQDFRNGRDLDVLGARISPEGKVLDPEPIPIAVGPGSQAWPDVASDGRGFMVAFQSHPDSRAQDRFKTRVVPVSSEGKAGMPIDALDHPRPRIAWDGAGYLVIGAGLHSAFAGRIFARLLQGDGAPKAPPFQFGAAGHAPVAALTAQPGKGWHVSKHRNYPDFWGWGGPPAQMGYFITSEGKVAADFPKEEGYPKADVLQPGWLDVYDRAAKTAPYGPSAGAWDGRTFVVVWQRFRQPPAKGYFVPLVNGDLILGRVDGWKPLDGRGHPLTESPDEEQWPSLACSGPGRLLCVYTKSSRDGALRVVARTVQSAP